MNSLILLLLEKRKELFVHVHVIRNRKLIFFNGIHVLLRYSVTYILETCIYSLKPDGSIIEAKWAQRWIQVELTVVKYEKIVCCRR